MKSELTQLIEQVKQEKSLTQYAIAEKLGYEHTYLSQLLNGKKPVSKKLIEKIKLTFLQDNPSRPPAVNDKEPLHLQVIMKLTHSNEILARNNEVLSRNQEKLIDANVRLVHGNEELIAMTKISFDKIMKAAAVPLEIKTLVVDQPGPENLSLGKRSVKKEGTAASKGK